MQLLCTSPIHKKLAHLFPVSFLRRHARASKPVCLRTGDPWQLFSKREWEPSNFKEKYEHCAFTVTSHETGKQNRMFLGDFFRYMSVCHSDEGFDPLYLFEHRLPESLRTSMNIPSVLKEADILSIDERKGNFETLPPMLRKAQYLLVGGHGSGMGFHVDPYGVSAWSMLASGRKLWVGTKVFCETLS